ncbi:MAG: V-type ATP synthase subunit I [Chlamydiales bacterium]
MRIDINKYLLMGPMSMRDQCFQEIQKLGIMDFIADKSSRLQTSPEIQNFIDALHILHRMVPVKQESVHDDRSAPVLAHHVIERNRELEALQEKVRVLEKEMSRIEIFGNFLLSDLADITQQTGWIFQFFFAKTSQSLEAPKDSRVIFIDHAHGLDYFIAINKQPTSYHGFVEIIIEHSVGDLKDEIAQAKRYIDEYETELAMLAHNKKVLKRGLVTALNHYHLEEAKADLKSLLEGEMFAIEGWIPKNKIAILKKFANEFNIYIEPIQIEVEDKVPTYLENKGSARLGQDLISIYDTPSSTDKDPSLWVFIAFGVFFSMILADAGYGLLLFGLSLFCYFKFGKKTAGLTKRITLLMMSLSIGSILWGVMLTSFFGIELEFDNKLRHLSLINWMVEQKADYLLSHHPKAYMDLIDEYPNLKTAKTPEQFLIGVKRDQEGMGRYLIYDTFNKNVLIELAIFVGTIHIILSFVRYLDRNWAGLGWILFMIGAYLYFPIVLGALSMIHYIFHIPYEVGGEVGKYILFIGLGLTVILALIQKRLQGLGEIMHVIEVFADVMSYLRIYALSLAGMIMGATFNQIGTSMPIYIGIFVMIAGHAINITLAIMGGVIHGLRLNFIEWYHYSFDGGGKEFCPLKMIKLD